MPGVGTKQQKTSEAARTIATTSDPLLTPDALLNDFGQLCVSLPATGALIAVRDLFGLRCTVSFGQAPAVGSMLPTDSALITQCFATGELALSEDLSEGATTDQENAASIQQVAASDAEISPTTATSASIRSAIAVPIRAQESVIALIEVFSSQPSAFGPIAIAELQQVAKSFATLMLFDAAIDGQSLVGGPLDHPIYLAIPVADQQPPENANPGAEPIDKPAPFDTLEIPASAATLENPPAVPTIETPETRKISKPAAAIPVAVSVTKAAATPGASTLSQLPSDRPTPRRVWLIAAILLVALSLLALLLYKTASHEHDISSETTNRTTSLDQRIRT